MEALLNSLQRQRVFPIGEAGEVAAARRAGNALAADLGFDETGAGRVALVITEAGTNIVKHAQRGEILLRTVERQGKLGVEVIALDSGPGIADLGASMVDGNSTTGTYGVGLGALQRQADEFDVYTRPGGGSALYMLVWREAPSADMARRKTGAICLPMRGETACGDSWGMAEADNRLTVMVADGLGHGPLAAQASNAAIAVLDEHPEASPAELIQLAHGALLSTRGAAIAVARLDSHKRQVEFAGIGNIVAAVFESNARRHLVSHNGIVGSNMRRIQPFTSAWSDDSLLIMHSDGLSTRWDTKNHPGLLARHPGLIASTLYRDFARMTDDATVVAVSER